jgi:hypothetical protein
MPDKTFTIVAQRTVLMQNMDTKEPQKKLILSVKLYNDTIIDYFPNRTSQKTIIATKGYRLSDWVGFVGKFYTESQKVGQFKREVIYIEA